MNSITAPATRHTWTCSDCGATAFGAGTHFALVFLGWQVSDNGEVWCPDCHLLGEEQVQAQLNGALVYIILAQRTSTEPEIGEEIRRLAEGGTVNKPPAETH